MAWRALSLASSRGARRLLFVACTWTVIGLLLLPLLRHDRGATYLSHIHRGLLQKIPQTDLSTPALPQLSDFYSKRPQVDSSPQLSEKQLLYLLSNTSTLPLSYWADHKARPQGNKCATFPSLFDLDFNNIYWQRLQTQNGTFYLYGAYYDDRWRGGNSPSVRILVMVDKIKPPPITCQLWFDKLKSPVLATASYTYAWFSKWGNYKDGILQPFVVTCKVPKQSSNGKVPDSVSLVEKACDKPKTNLRVLNLRPPKKDDFAVCVKGLDFLHEDLSVRMVEWIELLNILGASKVFLYELEIHPNISKVLNYYQNIGLVHLTPVTLPGNQPNLPGFRHLYLKSKLTHKRQNELIPYNDCLYRNLYSFKYVVLLDIDEVIVPLKFTGWREMMNLVEQQALQEKNYSRASYNIRNVYFLDDLQDENKHEHHEKEIPRYLHMLQHVYRSKNFTKPGAYVKCFHNTERVVSLHNHFPLNCFGTCTTFSVNTSVAQLQHYRKDCVGSLVKSCKTDFRVYTARDTTIWRYKDELIKRTTNVLHKLGFFA